MEQPRQHPLWLRIILNACGPLGLGVTLLGYVKPELGLLFMAITVACVIWELHPKIHGRLVRRPILSLIAFVLCGASLGGMAWYLLRKTAIADMESHNQNHSAPDASGKVQQVQTPAAVSPTPNKASSPHSGAVSDLSNAQVLDGARDLTRRLRQFQQESNQESYKLTGKFTRQMTAQDMTKEQAEDVQREMVLELGKLHDKNEARFGPLRAESRNIINMLQNRVPQPQPMPSELVSIALSTGPLAGPNPVGAVADYIDQLADLLPVKR